MADDSDHVGSSAAYFILFNWVGGDPAYILAGKMSNPEQIENIRKQLGVDQPYYVQLWILLSKFLLLTMAQVGAQVNPFHKLS